MRWYHRKRENIDKEKNTNVIYNQTEEKVKPRN
jgi:hypothetical protein